MRNCYLSPGTERAIDKQVAKVLRGLGNPQPPVVLEQVFELLELDPQFYTTTADGVFRETVSRIRIGTLQVFMRPMLILEAIANADLKALYVPDKRRILIDSSLPDLKVRWNSTHEVVHSICDWHNDVMYGDNATTLSQACHEQIEHEANYGAGRLLTLQDTFAEHVGGQRLTLGQINEIGKLFGNTWTSTLWRVVETLDFPAFAVIGTHPKRRASEEPCRYFIRSRPFEARFSGVNEGRALASIRPYCGFQTKGPLGKAEVPLTDDNGEAHIFCFESFATPYDVLTLAQAKTPSRARTFVSANIGRASKA